MNQLIPSTRIFGNCSSSPALRVVRDVFADYLLTDTRKLGFTAKRDKAGNVIGSVGVPDAEKTISCSLVTWTPCPASSLYAGGRKFALRARGCRRQRAAGDFCVGSSQWQPTCKMLKLLSSVLWKRKAMAGVHLAETMPRRPLGLSVNPVHG